MRKAPLLLCQSIHHLSFCSVTLFFHPSILPSIHPSIHPSLTALGALHPLSLFYVCLSDIHAVSVAQSQAQTVKPTPGTHQTPTVLPQLCCRALPAPQPVCGPLRRCVSSFGFLLWTMCECLRGIFRVTWAPSSDAGQGESLYYFYYSAVRIN